MTVVATLARTLSSVVTVTLKSVPTMIVALIAASTRTLVNEPTLRCSVCALPEPITVGPVTVEHDGATTTAMPSTAHATSLFMAPR